MDIRVGVCAVQEWRAEDLFTIKDEKKHRKIDKSLTTDWLDFDPRQPHTQKLCQSSCISFVAGPSSAASHFNLTTDWRNNRQFISHRSLSRSSRAESVWLIDCESRVRQPGHMVCALRRLARDWCLFVNANNLFMLVWFVCVLSYLS